jgi:hypothetical protein
MERAQEFIFDRTGKLSRATITILVGMIAL